MNSEMRNENRTIMDNIADNTRNHEKTFQNFFDLSLRGFTGNSIQTRRYLQSEIRYENLCSCCYSAISPENNIQFDILTRSRGCLRTIDMKTRNSLAHE